MALVFMRIDVKPEYSQTWFASRPIRQSSLPRLLCLPQLPFLLSLAQAQDKYHGVAKFDVASGKQKKGGGGPPTYTQVFADALVAEARVDERVQVVHAAMGGGTGINHFEKFYPERWGLPGACPLLPLPLICLLYSICDTCRAAWFRSISLEKCGL